MSTLQNLGYPSLGADQIGGTLTDEQLLANILNALKSQSISTEHAQRLINQHVENRHAGEISALSSGHLGISEQLDAYGDIQDDIRDESENLLRRLFVMFSSWMDEGINETRPPSENDDDEKHDIEEDE